jgi:PHD/YefM family antitoxin component YafN of YafNO toxin-antitoxin module
MGVAGGKVELRSMRLVEFYDGFRESITGMALHPSIRVAKVDGEPLYPWRRSELAAVTAYRERLLADMRELEDRLRRLEALLSVEELAAAGKEG